MSTTEIDPRIEAAAKALYENSRDPDYTGTEWDWENIDRSYDYIGPGDPPTAEWCRDIYRSDARAALAAAYPLIEAALANATAEKIAAGQAQQDSAAVVNWAAWRVGYIAGLDEASDIARSFASPTTGRADV